MKKKILILFSSAHLSHSPTVLGLYDLLSKDFDVAILAQSPEAYGNRFLTDRKIVYRKRFRSNRHFRKLYGYFVKLRSILSGEIKSLKKLEIPGEAIFDFLQVKKYFAETDFDFVIAVDFKSLFYAQRLGVKAEFLSLEIVENDIFQENCDFTNINSVVIQTAERGEYLFKDKKFKTFFVQNAPVYKKIDGNPNRENLVYCGTAWNPFGFYHCLDFLKKYSEYTLYVKGVLFDEDRRKTETNYRKLISEKRLVIDDKYLNDDELTDYLRQFKIGLCFYNFEVEWINAFNYYSAPSGKMFKYFAAGVPVVGQNIQGLQPVKEFDCGVLIEDLEPESIKRAIEKIESNFEYYSQNCLKAAAHYSFDKMAKPFVKYLSEKSAEKN